MKFFIGTYNEKYKKRLHSVLSQDYKLEFIESDEQVLQIFENAFNIDLLEETGMDYTVVMLDKEFYDKINISRYYSDGTPSYFTLVMICDNVGSVDIYNVINTQTMFMMPMNRVTNKEISLQIELLIHNIFDIRHIQNLANFDMLTKLHNRRSFLKNLDGYFYAFKKDKVPFCLSMLDLDHFKKINDTFGHADGDDVLYKVAGIMQRNCRKTDVVGRIGGEEFGIIFPNTTLKNAYDVLERIRLNVENAELPDARKITISAGLVISDAGYGEYKELYEKADTLLYKAKQEGRNKICIN